jgi:hypothetical protein
MIMNLHYKSSLSPMPKKQYTMVLLVRNRVDWSQLARLTRLQGCNLEWDVYHCVS